MGDWARWAAKVDQALKPQECGPDAALRPGEIMVARVDQPLESAPDEAAVPLKPIPWDDIAPIPWDDRWNFPVATNDNPRGVGVVRDFCHKWAYEQFLARAIAECGLSLERIYSDVVTSGFKMSYYSQLRPTGQPIKPLSESSSPPQTLCEPPMMKYGIFSAADFLTMDVGGEKPLSASAREEDMEADLPILVAAQDLASERGLFE